VLAAAREGDDENPNWESDKYQFYIITGKHYSDDGISEIEGMNYDKAIERIYNKKAEAYTERLEQMRKQRDRDGVSDLLDSLLTAAQTEVAANPPTPFTTAQKRAYRARGGAPWLDGEYTVFGEVIEGMKIVDKGGNEVLLSSTGTKFEHIGKLTISDGEFTTELIKTADYQQTDPVVDAYIKQIEEEYAELGNRKIAYSEVDLITKDADGNRLVRNSETNLGDLCAEAFRSAVNAQIGYINGGSLRADILAGDVTFNHLLNVLPFNNSIVLAEITGQTLKDMMEMAVMSWPAEAGSFPHLAGLRFSVNTAIPSSVVLNEQEEFVSVSGEYRVYNMEVFNEETGKYEPLELTKTYTFGASNFYLLDHGSGMMMLKNAKIIQNEGMLDVEALEQYIIEELGGTIGEEYANVKPNITFTDGEITTSGEESVESSETESTTEDVEETSTESESTLTESVSTPDTTDVDSVVAKDDPAAMAIVIVVSVTRGVMSTHQRQTGGHAYGRGRDTAIVSGAVRHQRIHGGCLDLLVAARADAVGSQLITEKDQNVLRCHWGLPPIFFIIIHFITP
jgi:cyclophilin family peptidyl-prolyl cis-trans isomerase